MAATTPPPHLLSLPYDIRHQIYRHVFPPGEQIYIQAFRDSLRSITARGAQGVPTELLRVCRGLNADASEHLYSSYLFNIVGRKADCLAAYKRFLATVEKHARHAVHVDAFSNGDHSATMCVSIHAGEGRMDLLRNRERGEPKAICELEREVAMKVKPLFTWTARLNMLSFSVVKRHADVVMVIGGAVAVVVIAWLISGREFLGLL